MFCNNIRLYFFFYHDNKLILLCSVVHSFLSPSFARYVIAIIYRVYHRRIGRGQIVLSVSLWRTYSEKVSSFKGINRLMSFRNPPVVHCLELATPAYCWWKILSSRCKLLLLVFIELGRSDKKITRTY